MNYAFSKNHVLSKPVTCILSNSAHIRHLLKVCYNSNIDIKWSYQIHCPPTPIRQRGGAFDIWYKWLAYLLCISIKRQTYNNSENLGVATTKNIRTLWPHPFFREEYLQINNCKRKKIMFRQSEFYLVFKESEFCVRFDYNKILCFIASIELITTIATQWRWTYWCLTTIYWCKYLTIIAYRS